MKRRGSVGLCVFSNVVTELHDVSLELRAGCHNGKRGPVTERLFASNGRISVGTGHGTLLERVVRMSPHSETDSSFAQPSACTVEEGIVRYTSDLERRARSLTRDDARAQDLVQDTVVRALHFKNTYRDRARVRAWLMRIMFHLFVSGQRRVHIERRVLERAPREPDHWSGHNVQSEPSCTPPIERALGQIPDKLAETVRLVDLLDYSYLEAAAAQQVPVGTIMSRLHRGRARLATALSS